MMKKILGSVSRKSHNNQGLGKCFQPCPKLIMITITNLLSTLKIFRHSFHTCFPYVRLWPFSYFPVRLMNLEGYPYMGYGERSTIDSRFSVHYLVMVHAGSLENTKEAPRMAPGAAESSFSFLSALQTLRLQTYHNSMMRSLRHESIAL